MLARPEGPFFRYRFFFLLFSVTFEKNSQHLASLLFYHSIFCLWRTYGQFCIYKNTVLLKFAEINLNIRQVDEIQVKEMIDIK